MYISGVPLSCNHHQKTTTTQCILPECKSGICACGWKEKHHRRKLQWVKPPRVQGESLCQHHLCKLLPMTTTTSTRCKVRVQGAKVRTSISTSRNGIQKHQPPPPPTSSGSAPALVECTMQQSLQLAEGLTLRAGHRRN